MTNQTQNAYHLERQKILKSYFEDILKLLDNQSNIDSTLLGIKETYRKLLSQSDKELSFDSYLQLLGELQQHSAISGIGLKTGSIKSVKNFGIYGYALLSSANLTQFNAVAERIFNAIYEPLTIQHEVIGNQLVITYDTLKPLSVSQYIPLMEQVVLCGMALMQARLPTSTSWADCTMNCRYPAPAYQALYPQYFAGQINFNMPQMQLCVPADWMDITFDAGDAFVFSQCNSQIDAILANFQQATQQDQHSWSNKVRQVLLTTSFNHTPTAVEIASQFFTVERTLRYRLAQENTSFRQILNEVKLEMAKRYLVKSDLAIQEIAFVLGYQHVQNFYRAFGKDTQTTPEKYRLQHFEV